MSGVLLKWLAGLGEMVQQVDSLSLPTPYEGVLKPGWSQVLDINRAPTSALPWLGQFVGVRFDSTLRDDQQRYVIVQERGFKRGTVGAILAAANQFVRLGATASIAERDTSPYHLTITIPLGGISGTGSCLSLSLAYAECSDLPLVFATCADLWSTTIPVEQAILAAIPAGLVAVLDFV